MEKHDLKGGLWNLLISLAAALGAGMLLVTGTSTAVAVLIFLGVGVLVAAVSWVHMHLANREGLEQLELEEVSQGRGGEALFAEGDVLPSKRSREQYERWAVPVVAVAMFSLQAWGVYHLGFKELPGLLERIEVNQAAETGGRLLKFSALIITALLGLILFLRGQFAANFARIEKQRLLQPASDYVLFGAYLNFALAAMVAVSFKFPAVDYYVALALTILLGLLAVENVLSMIFEIYRPRMADRRARLLYQSRLVGLIAKPENLFTTVGKVLNYQFGFKVSETWGYQFLRKRLWVLFGVQVILLWLSTSIVVIKPSEVGKKMSAWDSAAEAQTLEPGFHLKLPWPFAQVDRFYPGQVHSFIVGLQPLEEPGRPKLWTHTAWQDYDALRLSGRLYFMAGSSVTRTPGEDPKKKKKLLADILVASIPVHYRIRKDKLDSEWLHYQQTHLKEGKKSDAQRLLESIAYREIVAHFLGSNLRELLHPKGAGASEKVRAAIEAEANQKGLGVDILFVGLGNIRPPAKSPYNVNSLPAKTDTGEDLSDDSGNKKEQLLKTPMAVAVEQGFASKIYARTELKSAEEFKSAQEKWQAVQLDQVAVGERMKIDLAKILVRKQRDRLEGQSGPYHAAPQLHRQWLYLVSFRKAVAPARKYIIAVGPHTEVEVNLDLQESLKEISDLKPK